LIVYSLGHSFYGNWSQDSGNSKSKTSVSHHHDLGTRVVDSKWKFFFKRRQEIGIGRLGKQK